MLLNHEVEVEAEWPLLEEEEGDVAVLVAVVLVALELLESAAELEDAGGVVCCEFEEVAVRLALADMDDLNDFSSGQQVITKMSIFPLLFCSELATIL